MADQSEVLKKKNQSAMSLSLYNKAEHLSRPKTAGIDLYKDFPSLRPAPQLAEGVRPKTINWSAFGLHGHQIPNKPHNSMNILWAQLRPAWCRLQTHHGVGFGPA